MQLLIPFASLQDEACKHVVADLQLPHLAPLLASLQATLRCGSDEASLTPPHERALAAALGWQGADGCLPWAARSAAADGIADLGDAPCGLLTPAHWRVDAEGVSLADPESLALSEAESRALFDAVRPLFESESWRLRWGAPLRWYAIHESLRELPCASLDRAVGRGVDAWLAPAPGALRRLHSEAQMLLYRDPVNDAREARGLPAVNSLWLHGCGVAQAPLAAGPRIDSRLRGPALAADWAAWAEAWRALDAGPLADLLRAAQRGAAVALTLAGERCAQRFETGAAQPLWTRLARRLRPPQVAQVLEAL